MNRMLDTTELIDQLPDHLSERSRLLKAGTNSNGQFVLYWMQTAMRDHENAALDAARLTAAHLGLPLLVYQGLSERYAYASDRHHTFILEGMRDLQSAFSKTGICYGAYVENCGKHNPNRAPGTRGVLSELLSDAAVVIVEDMPTDPQRKFVRAALRGCDHARRPAWIAVDTACVVPMSIVGEAYERAFEYRKRTSKALSRRLGKPWPTIEANPKPFDLAQLNIEWLDFNRESIQEIVARCDIDHSVSPVMDTVGGMTAGYERWNLFKAEKLRNYARDRNDPLRHGSSRMSAYLHYGMVAPTRIAREANDAGGEGAHKFLDELLIWREMAYAFCRYRADHSQWIALPDWARETLEQHASDERPFLYTWEQLSRGDTHDQLWNAAQKSLLVHGELHNNVRMTWGKAVVDWCLHPRQALSHIIDLNNRYALDGRDPSSFGGLLWCLGQFDRPFYPETRIFGTVRNRPTLEHSRRLSVAEYAQWTTRRRLRSGSPVPSTHSQRIAVIGSGLSGCIAARGLQDMGFEVTVFDKSRGPSGRMSTRRTDHAHFDHGAQYFTCRDARFRKLVDSWLSSEVVARWDGTIGVFAEGVQTGVSDVERFVATPHMSSLCKYLASDLNVQYETHVQSVERERDTWTVIDSAGKRHGNFHKAVLSLPAPQSASLIADPLYSDFVSQLRNVAFDPCWAVMAVVDRPIVESLCGAFINSGPIRWFSRNNTKPGRQRMPESIVIHAQPEWSKQHLEHEPPFIVQELMPALWQALGISDPPVVLDAFAHRWRYAMPVNTEPLSAHRALVSHDQSLIACGDWASGSRVEGAFLSGQAAIGICSRVSDH